MANFVAIRCYDSIYLEKNLFDHEEADFTLLTGICVPRHGDAVLLFG